MQALFIIGFFIMFLPAFLTVAFAARSVPMMLWNYTWFFVFAKVGVAAFASIWGGLPGLAFALHYTYRVLRPRPRKNFFDTRFFMGFPSPNTASRRGSFSQTSTENEENVIEAQFRREESRSVKSQFVESQTVKIQSDD